MTNVVEVKVGLHCDVCIKKILKAIKKIEVGMAHLPQAPSLEGEGARLNNCSTGMISDIETYNVDKQQSKVIVTGNVTTEEVIRVLHKIGRNATAWEEEVQCA